MKPSNPNLLAVLSSREFYTADLYQFILNEGSVIAPTMFADTTTEGVGNHYWANNTQQASFAAWLTAVGGTFSRGGPAYRTNSAGLLASVGTNVLRFDYDPLSLAPKGILIEGASTNLIFDSLFALWGSQVSATLTTNAAVGPDGTTTAAKITMIANSISGILRSATATGTLTVSCWMKGLNGGEQANFAYFNGTDGEHVSPTFTLTTTWTRYSWTASPSPTQNSSWYIINGAALVSETIFAWGYQLEALDHATSYIPTTTGGTASRSADNLNVPWTSTTGTFLLTTNSLVARGFSSRLLANNANTNDAPITANTPTLQIEIFIDPADIGVTVNFTGSWNSTVRSAVTGTPSNVAISANGATPATGSIALFGTTPNGLVFFQGGGQAPAFGELVQFGAWSVQATTAQLQALTTSPTLGAIAGFPSWLPVFDNRPYLFYAGGGAQIDIAFGGNTYKCGGATGPYFDRTDNKAKVSWKLGSGNDQLVLDVAPGSATVGNLGFLDAVRCGVFDAADFQLSRAFMLAQIATGNSIPAIYADFANQNFWFNGQTYSFSGWLTALNGTFARTTNAYYTNASGNLTLALAGAARFDYDPVALTPKGILLESASTNLALQSNTFSNASWTATNATLAQNVTGPDGIANSAWTLTSTSATDSFIQQSISPGAINTFSIYVKLGTSSFVFLQANNPTNAIRQWFNLNTATATSQSTTGGGAPVISNASIINQSNGWYRISITTDSTPTIFVIAQSDADNSIGSTVGHTLLIWGAQVEALSFATSYFPTVTSITTRAQDKFSFPNVAGTNATILLKTTSTQGTTGVVYSTDGDSNSDLIEYTTSGGNPIEVATSNGSVSYGAFLPSGTYISTPTTWAYTQNGSQSSLCVNGSAVSNNAAQFGAATAIVIGSQVPGVFANPVGGDYATFGYWNAAVTNAQLSTLTTSPIRGSANIGLPSWLPLLTNPRLVNGYGTVQTGCAVLMFQGRVAEVDSDRSLATFTINDYRELLSQQLPRNLFAASCANSFGDASCTVVLANFSENGTVQTGTTQSAIKTTLVRVSDYYDMGKITFTSGQLNGLSFGVSTWIQGTPGTITPLSALPHVPAVGDTFTIAPGCDKTFTGGCTKYSNTPNFRGFPYIPAPETAV